MRSGLESESQLLAAAQAAVDEQLLAVAEAQAEIAKADAVVALLRAKAGVEAGSGELPRPS